MKTTNSTVVYDIKHIADIWLPREYYQGDWFTEDNTKEDFTKSEGLTNIRSCLRKEYGVVEKGFLVDRLESKTRIMEKDIWMKLKKNKETKEKFCSLTWDYFLEDLNIIVKEVGM